MTNIYVDKTDHIIYRFVSGEYDGAVMCVTHYFNNTFMYLDGVLGTNNEPNSSGRVFLINDVGYVRTGMKKKKINIGYLVTYTLTELNEDISGSSTKYYDITTKPSIYMFESGLMFNCVFTHRQSTHSQIKTGMGIFKLEIHSKPNKISRIDGIDIVSDVKIWRGDYIYRFTKRFVNKDIYVYKEKNYT